MKFENLKKLNETPGIAGREDQIRKMVKEWMRPLVDELKVDALGNVICMKRGISRKKKRRKVMLAAHMDEIGFMVRFIDDKGFVRLQPIGGFDTRQLFSQRVLIHTQRGQVRGVLSYATKPIHMLTAEDKKGVPEVQNFFVDTGLPAKKLKKWVSIGDMVTMDRSMEKCGEMFVSKAMDDRVGLFAMIEALRLLKGKNHEVDVYAVATAQEEVGLRGAATAAFAVDPDVSIAVDVTIANDYPGIEDSETVTRLGAGAAIKIMDASHIGHPRLIEHLREIATGAKIPHQMEILPKGGTDAGAMQRSRFGSACATLSIPIRYIHTANEMVNKNDVENTILLLALYLQVAHQRDYSL